MTYRTDMFQKPKAGPSRPLEIGAKRTYLGSNGVSYDCIVLEVGPVWAKVEIKGKVHELAKELIR